MKTDLSKRAKTTRNRLTRAFNWLEFTNVRYIASDGSVTLNFDVQIPGKPDTLKTVANTVEGALKDAIEALEAWALEKD